MKIEIADDLYDKLSHQAAQAGYVDVTAYVAALADRQSSEPHADFERLKAADAAIDAGRGIDGEDAMRRIAAKHRFSIGE